MGLLKFQLHFDSEIGNSERVEKSFFPGETLIGHVLVELGKDKKVQELKLHWVGVCKITTGFSIKSHEAPALASEVYFDEKINLINKESIFSLIPSENNNNAAVYPELYHNKPTTAVAQNSTPYYLLPAGLHKFPFAFKLPTNCPSSFQEPYAFIKYSATASLVRPHPKKPPHVIHVPFTINGLYDLNVANIYIEPTRESSDQVQVQVQNNKNNTNKKLSNKSNKGQELKKFSNKLGWLNCITNGSTNKNKNGTKPKGIDFNLRLLRDYYVPGEYIQFSIQMNNNTKYEVSDISLSLWVESKYYTKQEGVGGGVKSGLRTKLDSSAGPIVNPHSSELWETNVDDSLFLQIPSVPPTNLGGGDSASKLISVRYYLEFIMEVGNDSINGNKKMVKEQFPIIIGSVPHVNNFKEFIALKKKSKTKTNNNNNNEEIQDKNDDNGNTNDKVRQSIGDWLGYPELCDPSFQDASPNAYANAAPPPIYKTPKNSRKMKKSVVDDEENDENVDSDEEYLEANHPDDVNEFNFVPKYANYTSIYGLDLAELMGPPIIIPPPPSDTVDHPKDEGEYDD